MPEVGSGVMEIRLHGHNEFRVFYVARFAEAVYVLHCFVKKTQATRKADIDLASGGTPHCLRRGNRNEGEGHDNHHRHNDYQG